MIAPKHAISPATQESSETASIETLTCFWWKGYPSWSRSVHPPCTEIRKMRNKQKHNNVTVANQFTVHNCYYKIFLKWKNTDTSMVFFPPFHQYQKMWGLVVSLKKGQSSKSNFYHNSYKFLKKFGHLISLSRLYVQIKIKISGGSFYNCPKPFSGLS